MKQLLFTVVISILAAWWCNGDAVGFVPAFENAEYVGPYSLRQDRPDVTNASNICPGPIEYRCSPDCSQLLVCDGTGPRVVQTCPAGTYCDRFLGNCTTNLRGSVCASYNPSAQCLSEFSIDLTDCRRFYYCSNNYFYTYACDAGYVRDIFNASCVRGQCITFTSTTNCQNQANRFVPYPGYPQLYVLCGNATASAKAYICPTGYGFNGVDRCVPVCTQAGRYPIPSNTGIVNSNTYYYECLATGNNTYTIRTGRCPDQFVFNSTVQLCVRG